LAAIGWGQFAATLAPALILGVLWKGVTKTGGWVGVAASTLVAFFLTIVFRLPKAPLSPLGLGTLGFIKQFYLDAGAWGMVVGFIVIIVVSLVTKKERGPLYYDIHKIPAPATAAPAAPKP
jgi:Na+(H+)/acetate symporter ActP